MGEDSLQVNLTEHIIDPLGRVVGLGAERPGRVGDAVAATVVLDFGGTGERRGFIRYGGTAVGGVVMLVLGLQLVWVVCCARPAGFVAGAGRLWSLGQRLGRVGACILRGRGKYLLHE